MGEVAGVVAFWSAAALLASARWFMSAECRGRRARRRALARAARVAPRPGVGARG